MPDLLSLHPLSAGGPDLRNCKIGSWAVLSDIDLEDPPGAIRG